MTEHAPSHLCPACGFKLEPKPEEQQIRCPECENECARHETFPASQSNRPPWFLTRTAAALVFFPAGVSAALFATMGFWGDESENLVAVVLFSYLLVMPLAMLALACQRVMRYFDTPEHRRSLGVAALVIMMALVGTVITLGTLWLLSVAWAFSDITQ